MPVLVRCLCSDSQEYSAAESDCREQFSLQLNISLKNHAKKLKFILASVITILYRLVIKDMRLEDDCVLVFSIKTYRPSVRGRCLCRAVKNKAWLEDAAWIN